MVYGKEIALNTTNITLNGSNPVNIYLYHAIRFMADQTEKINLLSKKLESFSQRQNDLAREIFQLRMEIGNLKGQPSGLEKKPIVSDLATSKTGFQRVEEEMVPITEKRTPPAKEPAFEPSVPGFTKPPKLKSDLEKFIGENLISKIGIGITVFGVSIGAKYAIDNELISPLTRIILGYLVGVGLLGFAIRLKPKYDNFSAVLLSGAMAILYFITLAAYSFYSLIPQGIAFALMVILTGFTVLASINYNKQVIAHFGLVGAYAVPFLLSDGSGQIAVLFTYMAVINGGILAIAFKKYWKSLYFVSFGLTWLIYGLWYFTKYDSNTHFVLGLTFLSVYFVLFYLTFLAYKLVKKEKFEELDIVLLLANAFVFYGLGYAIISGRENGEQWLGLFTLFNAGIHFIVSAIIFRQKLADRNLFYLVSGLVLVFITIAVPVQLDGHWVTLLWAGEAALLFWIGKKKAVAVYEKLSYPLMLLSFLSLLQDWTVVYNGPFSGMKESGITPVFNIHFLSSLLFIAAFIFINILNSSKENGVQESSQKPIAKGISYLLPAILLFTIYYAVRLEIENFWDQLFINSVLPLSPANQSNPEQIFNYDLLQFKAIWVINYTLLYGSLLAWVNMGKWKHPNLGLFNIVFILLTLVAFFMQGLLHLSTLRESYLSHSSPQYYQKGIYYLLIRYISFVFAGLSLYVLNRYIRQAFIQKDFSKYFDILLHISLLWILSSELIHWMELGDSTQSYKLGLSILWGIYALFLISLGIRTRKKVLRIGAIILFGATLLKLFLYDISALDTIAKTIVFVSLGVLLLIISFLYNKYKHIIADETNI